MARDMLNQTKEYKEKIKALTTRKKESKTYNVCLTLVQDEKILWFLKTFHPDILEEFMEKCHKTGESDSIESITQAIDENLSISNT